MAKIKKRGTSGSAKNYITRSQAVRKLQVSLGDFRRLCIFKGIYPREPRSKKRVSKSSTPSTTFYYTKDIQYLLHEPVLSKFRDQKALAKKISKALGRNEVSDALRLERNLTPRIRLDHIIKERYPTFVDALRDLDDALSMLYLFANLPSTTEVPTKIISRCNRLTMEFEHYLIRTHSLRKSFLSIKGIYYQATIQGQDVLWLLPYKFVQRTDGDIDFRILATFVDFYTTLLGFVNFRLYTSIGLVYPPRFDLDSEERGAGLEAFQLEGHSTEGQQEMELIGDTESNEKAQAEADRLLSTSDGDKQEVIGEGTRTAERPAEDEPAQNEDAALDQFAPIDEKADNLLQPSLTADASVAAKLFEPFTFYLSRETPRHQLEFILKAFGCKRVGWDSVMGEPGAYCSQDDKRITHEIVDRPDLPVPSPPLTDGETDADNEEGAESMVRSSNRRVPGRTYVQPQWVWDSINAGQLQRADLYAPGATLPPHLSPWVKPKKGDYDPTVPLAETEEVEREEDVESDPEQIEEGSEGEEVKGVRGDEEAKEMEARLIDEEDDNDGDMAVELAGSEDDDDMRSSQQKLPTVPDDEWGGLSGDQAEDVNDAQQDARDHQAELEAEALGQQLDQKKSHISKAKQSAQAAKTKAEREAEEDVERRKMMMPRRKRKMYEKMVYSNARKDEETEKLRDKRRKIERAARKKA